MSNDSASSAAKTRVSAYSFSKSVPRLHPSSLLATAIWVLACPVVCNAQLDLQQDWPWWRGPLGNGHAAATQTPPVKFGERESVVWKVDVPGRGHASPTVVGDRIFLSTADEQQQVQGVICFDRLTGEQRWITPLHRGRFPEKIHPKNTHASGTVACDGERVYATYFQDKQVHLSALTLDGEVVWSKSTGRFDPQRYEFGYGASPLIFKDSVIVSAESDNGSYLVAYRGSDGEEVWRTGRRQDISFSSPIVGHVAEQQQLLISGLFEVSSFNPLNGELRWAVDGTTQATCGTMVWDGGLVFASGGYPDPQTIAVQADGSGKVAWANRVKCYEQSLLAVDGYVYAIADGGVAYCWRGADGEEMWKFRLGGDVSASPVFANGNIYAANEAGEIFIFRANPQAYTQVARTRLGTELFATPSFAHNQIYYRVAARKGGRRQEFLYAIGE